MDTKERKTKTAGDLIAGGGDFFCNLCSGRVAADKPDELWAYDTLGGHVNILGHYRCEQLWDALKGRRTELDSFLGSLGVADADLHRARQLLGHALETRNI
jgi:hypothetical protein